MIDNEPNNVNEMCHREGEYIIFKLPENCVDDDYHIALDCCSTPEEIIGWMRHLREKNWITEPVIRRFVKLATKHHGIMA
jgi:hypothetical protein